MRDVFVRAPRRRDPWPCDVVFSSIAGLTAGNSYRFGLMMGRVDKDGPLVIVAPPGLRGESSRLNYSAQDPEIEATYAWDDFVYGMGQYMQTDHEGMDRRYHAALGVNCSQGGLLFPGPEITSGTPGTRDSTNGITQFYELGGTLYAVNGRYILYWDGSNFAVSKDTGVGKVAKHAVVAKRNQSGSTAYAMVAMGDSDNYWYHDGASATTTWTQHATDKALCWVIRSDNIMRASDQNGVAQCSLDNDFLSAAQWTSASNWRIGDYQHAIQRLALNASGQLVVLKKDSVHVLTTDGEDISIYAGLGFTPAATNGLMATLWENWLYTQYNGTLLRIGPNMELEPIGPERLTENRSVVRGPVTATVGTPFALYGGLHNLDTSNSYLMQFGAWPRSEDGEPHRLEVWHGSLSTAFTSKSVTAMYVSTIAAPSNHRLVWMGFSDGTWSRFILPCSPNPLACTSTTFLTSGILYPPLWHGNFPGDRKVIRAMSVTGSDLATSSKYMAVAFETTAFGGVYTNPFATSNFETKPGSRLNTSGQAHTLLNQYWTINGPSATAPPVVTGVALHYTLHPEPMRIYEFAVLAEDGLTRHDGSRLAVGAQRIRRICRLLREDATQVSVTWPDDTSEVVTVTHYEETQAWDDRAKRWRAAVRLRAVQAQPTTESETFTGYTL